MLRVDRGGLALGHPEEVAVEAADVVEEGTPAGDRSTGNPGLRVVVDVRVPSVGGNLADEVVTAKQRLPQQLGRVDPPGQPAGHPDHGDGCRGRISQSAFSLFTPHDRGSSIAMRMP